MVTGSRSSLHAGNAMAARPDSETYVPVRCSVCGWQDGLERSLVESGDLIMCCDVCLEVVRAEVIESANAPASATGQEERS